MSDKPQVHGEDENFESPTHERDCCDSCDSCDSCDFPAPDLKDYSMQRNFPRIKDEKKRLCGLCAGTMTGTYHEYPEQYQDTPTLKTICYVGNAILAAIRGGK